MAKANKTLGFLYRRFVSSYIGSAQRKLLYLSLVRSHLSHTNKIWDSQPYITDLKQLGNVPRRARVLYLAAIEIQTSVSSTRHA